MRPTAQSLSNRPVRDRQSSQLSAVITRDSQLIEQAQRLRYQVFSEEFGATFDHPELDQDPFDEICDHLLVHDHHGKIIAYSRLISDQQASQLGRFYSESEFDLQQIYQLPGKKLEIGRTCIHPDYRSGAGLTALWSTLACHLLQQGYQWLIGCCSIPLDDQGKALHATLNVMSKQKDKAASVIPKTPLPYSIEKQLSKIINAETDDLHHKKIPAPALLKSYLRMGAKAIGSPCWDPEFNCADVFILLNIDDLPAKYLKYFARSTIDHA